MSATFRKVTSLGVLTNPIKLKRLLDAVGTLDADGRRPRPAAAGRPAARAGRRQRHVHHDPDRRATATRDGQSVILRRRVGDPGLLPAGDQPAEAEGARSKPARARRRDRRPSSTAAAGPGWRRGRRRADPGRLQGRRHRQRGPAGLHHAPRSGTAPAARPARARCSRSSRRRRWCSAAASAACSSVLGSDFSSVGAKRRPARRRRRLELPEGGRGTRAPPPTPAASTRPVCARRRRSGRRSA